MKKTVILSSMLAALLIAGACSDTDIYSSETTRPAVGIDDKSLTLDGKTESARISIASNIWWKAHVEYDGGGEWLEITPAEGFGDIEITVATERNYDLSTPKTARLVIVSDDGKGSFRKEFTVTQQTSEPYIEIDGLQSEGLAVGVTRSETPLTLYTNDAWEASTSDDSWCSVVSSDNGSGKKTVQLVCASNSTKRERSAEVTFRSKNTPGVVCSFRVNQSGIFAAPVLTLAKDESGAIRLAWDAVMGAVKYMVVLTDNNGAPIAEIDNGAETACDLSAQEVFAKPEYVGLFNVSIRALSDDPEVFSNSEAQSANSHFASGAGTQGDPFIIDRDGYLRNISTANAKAAGCYYKLTYTPAPGADFEPICSPADPFAGIFDGNGKTIEGWEIRPLADKRNYFGFFGAVAEGAEVASLNFSRCSLYITNDGGSVNKADNGFAWVAGTNNGTLRDIAVTDCTIACETGTTPLNVGGIAANNNGTVLRCTASGAISAAADRNKTDEFTCGGIAAYNYATGVVDQCVNHASITAMNQVGGVVGMNGGKVTGSGNTGAITANYYFGGVVGYTTSSSAACIIEKCYNTGTLTMDEPAGMGRGAAYMGGVTSRIYSNKTVISKCYNTGDLIVGASVSSSSLRIGGIVGHTNKPGRFTDCYNAGNATIKGKANYGGIVGEMADQAAVITNCYTVGRITVDGGSGNLFSAFGKASGKAVITDCYALDNGDAFAGGSTSGITGGGLLSEAQMKNPASYSGWDFVTVWQAGGGSYPYPTLR
ncbi:BACON domain-containing protein [Alistipes finegoldii]|uniref:BACON domain-containing protein n=1 Tax=Alistipes finegoldii TaxID=214856 RepID=UPI0025A39816|nr:BACON domain-containing protein [Alistipes finegoldii]